MLPQILIIEDDEDLLEALKATLHEAGFGVKTVTHGGAALTYLNRIQPDLAILDLTLPDMNGESVCAQIRKNYPTLPVTILTGKDSVSDKVYGFTLGADDYMTKPFATEELVARIKARLRPQTLDASTLRVADLELDSEKIEVKRGAKMINLTPQEFKLLEFLLRNKGAVLTRDMILNRIWLYSPDVETRVVDVYMGYLRRKIDDGFKRKLIHSIRGFGYTLKE